MLIYHFSLSTAFIILFTYQTSTTVSHELPKHRLPKGVARAHMVPKYWQRIPKVLTQPQDMQ